MTLGTRLAEGTHGMDLNCNAAFLYFEPAGLQTTKHVLRTQGLEVVEMRKLKLGPYILDTQLQIDDSTAIRAGGEGVTFSDIEEHMDFKG